MTHLKLPKDERAAVLFEALNERYFLFVSKLPTPLARLGERKGTYLGAPDEDPFAGIPGLNPVLASTPWLFWESFQDLEDEPFLMIAEAGACFVLASIIMDHLVDGQAAEPGLTALFHQALYEHGVTRFREVFPAQSQFWSHFERLAGDHLRGLAIEIDVQANPDQLNLDAFSAMAHGKVSPIVATIAALVQAVGKPRVLAPIETSLKHIAKASQLLDDVGDWEEDVKAGHLTYYLTRLAPPEAWGGEGWPELEWLRERIRAGWLDAENLQQVIAWLDQSLAAVEDLQCPAWVEYVEGYRTRANRHLTIAVGRHLKHTLAPLLGATEQ